MRKIRPLLERFMEKVDRNHPNGCWQWIAHIKKNGYGELTTGIISDGSRKKTFAHRLSFELFKGKIPDGYNVCHICDNQRCVNPDHLFIGTQFDNIRDCINKNRHKGGRHNASLTYCKRGHPFNEENTINRRGRRECKICVRQKKRERYHRNKELSRTKQQLLLDNNVIVNSSKATTK